MPDEGVRQTKPCPYCSEQVLVDAKKCKHCRQFIDPAMHNGTVDPVGREGKLPEYAQIFPPERKKRALWLGAGVVGAILAIGIASSAYHAIRGNENPTSDSSQFSNVPPPKASALPDRTAFSGNSQAAVDQSAPSCDALKTQVREMIQKALYPQARRKLIAAGWIPRIKKAPVFANPADDFTTRPTWDAGFKEVESCAGTGLSPCEFRFTDHHGNKLQVVGVGEDPRGKIVDNFTLSCANVAEGPSNAAKLPIVKSPPEGENVQSIDGRLVWLNPVIVTGLNRIDHSGTTLKLVRARLADYRSNILPFESAGEGYLQINSCPPQNCSESTMNMVFNNRTGEVLNVCVSPDARGKRAACAEGGGDGDI